MSVFNGLNFTVGRDLFYHILDNPDDGFNCSVLLKKNQLTELQNDTLDFVLKCYKKKLAGRIAITFNLDGIGEIKKSSRVIETIEKTKEGFTIKNTY